MEQSIENRQGIVEGFKSEVSALCGIYQNTAFMAKIENDIHPNLTPSPATNYRPFDTFFYQFSVSFTPEERLNLLVYTSLLVLKNERGFKGEHLETLSEKFKRFEKSEIGEFDNYKKVIGAYFSKEIFYLPSLTKPDFSLFTNVDYLVEDFKIFFKYRSEKKEALAFIDDYLKLISSALKTGLTEKEIIGILAERNEFITLVGSDMNSTQWLEKQSKLSKDT